MKTTTKLATLVLPSLIAACGTGSDDPFATESNGLFDLRVLVVPAPGNTTTHALCSDGNDAEQGARALVDDINADVAGDRALLEAIATAPGRSEGAVTVYEATVDGRTLRIEALRDGDDQVFVGTVDGEEVLEGATRNEGKEGALEYRELSVAWDEEDDGTLRAARDSGGEESVVYLEPERVRVVREETIAVWTTDSGIYLEGGMPLCWEGQEKCDVTCTTERVQELQEVFADGE